MIITRETKAETVTDRTKKAMELEKVPNMLLANVGKPNGFTTNSHGYNYWIDVICNKKI